MVGSAVNAADICASVCPCKTLQCPSACGILSTMHVLADALILYSLYPDITNISFHWLCSPNFLFSLTCFTEGNSDTKAVKRIGQHNCQRDFNLVGGIILCGPPERQFGFLQCHLLGMCSGSKSQYKFYFITYDENLWLCKWFLQVAKIFHYILAIFRQFAVLALPAYTI